MAIPLQDAHAEFTKRDCYWLMHAINWEPPCKPPVAKTIVASDVKGVGHNADTKKWIFGFTMKAVQQFHDMS